MAPCFVWPCSADHVSPFRHRNTSDSLLGRLTKGRLQRGESTGLARNVGLQPEALDDETEMEAMAKVWAHPEDLHLFPVRGQGAAAAVFLVIDGLLQVECRPR